MIFYFSGTGNSAYVAFQLGDLLNEEVGRIPDTDKTTAPDGKGIGFVFPVYSWGVPPNVVSFIHNIPHAFWEVCKEEDLPVWAVMTCGDETAMAPEMLQRTFARMGISLQSIWSVQMPNNYVLLPGFDVDGRQLEMRKLEGCKPRIREIADGISSGIETVDVVRGNWPRLKTTLVYPLFKRWGMNPEKWHSTEICNGCGICSRSCPQGNIRMRDKKPHWGKDCTSCLACYHACPRHAVEYGNATKKKGQYFLPRNSKKV